MRAAIYDAEARPREWARRLAGLGADRAGVRYIAPVDLARPLRGRPLWDIADALRDTLAADGVDLVIVDSAIRASALADDRARSDPGAPFTYVAALETVCRVPVSLGHPSRGNPDGDPFGSYAWVAAHRLTWHGRRESGGQHRVRWEVRKANERPDTIPAVGLTFEYRDGLLVAVSRTDDDEDTATWVLARLPGTVADLVDAWMEDHDEPDAARQVLTERIGRALRRLRSREVVDRAGRRPYRWTVWVASSADRTRHPYGVGVSVRLASGHGTGQDVAPPPLGTGHDPASPDVTRTPGHLTTQPDTLTPSAGQGADLRDQARAIFGDLVVAEGEPR
jgi:hypothetical protein